jgi:hypothetical protein
LMMTAPVSRAIFNARADFPEAVGPAIRVTNGGLDKSRLAGGIQGR